MKRIVCFVLILLLPIIALADDISSMTYDELIALRQQLNEEIMSRPEWREVTVPSGEWVVGKDIPAGEYSVSSGSGGAYINVTRPKGKSYDLIVNQGVTSTDNAIGRVNLKDGDVVTVKHGSLIFAPPISLGF